MTYENTMEAVLADGYTRKMANHYLGVIGREDANPIFDADYRQWAHEHGFFAINAYAFGLDEATVDDYLSDYEYYRSWPLNDWTRIWINDKMTLGYLLYGTEWEDLMPEMYFYASAKGLLPLTHAHGRGGYDAFLEVLREKGEFACKPCNGTRAAGFDKLGYAAGQYYIDNQRADEQDVVRFVDEHPNDIYTEFLHPGMGLERTSPVINTLRVLTCNPTGTEMHFAGSYLRFSAGFNGDDSKANYVYPDKADIYDINVVFDLDTGEFGKGQLIYPNRVVSCDTHPETGGPLSGRVAEWPQVRARLKALTDHLNLLEWMGYDVCFSDKGPKLMEINSHPGVKYLQCYHPFKRDPFLRGYFADKMARVDALVERAKGDPSLLVRRNNGAGY